jgi:hypothetical protein
MNLELVKKYLGVTGYWFASCPDFVILAEEAVKAGILQPASNIADIPEAKHFYVRAQLVSFEELPASLRGLFLESWLVECRAAARGSATPG